jgi:hypothetical protein
MESSTSRGYSSTLRKFSKFCNIPFRSASDENFIVTSEHSDSVAGGVKLNVIVPNILSKVKGDFFFG